MPGSPLPFHLHFPAGHPKVSPEMAHPLPLVVRRLAVAAMAAACAAALTQCTHETPVSHQFQEPRLGPKSYVTYDRQSFGYRKWLDKNRKPETIVIGIHGFCGAAIDYENLGKHLLDEHPSKGLYAYEVRGQGSDPNHERRGDISDPEDWYRDLNTFTQLMRKEHPDARIVIDEAAAAALQRADYFRSVWAAKPEWQRGC